MRDRSLLLHFEPSPGDPWDRAKAAHLLRRGGFGGAPSEVETAVKAGPRAAIEALSRGEESPAYVETLALEQTIAGFDSLEHMQAWWLLRLVRAAHPLREKMALFWHGHFATSNAKVGSIPLMMRQNRLFLECGLGRFEDLLQAVSRDPAMLVWLDSNLNRQGKPNENYARELMELFSLGIGSYTEADVKNAARAFTGFHVRDGEFSFDASRHDDGEKTLFGRTGALDGGDVVSMCVRRSECAGFISRKIFAFFAYDDPEPALAESLADSFRKSELDVSRLVETILLSRAFFSPRARRPRIKSPVELAVGAVRLLGATGDGRAHARAVSSMGQSLFQPPTVKGWDGGRHWVSAAALLARVNFIAALSRAPRLDGELAGRVRAADAEGAVDAILESFADGSVPDGVRARLVEAARGLGSPEERFRALVRLSGALPEFQTS